MSDVEYILGTGEYHMVEITNETPGETFVPAAWTATMYLANTAQSVVIDDVSTWESASIETVGTKFYSKALISDLISDVGVYRTYVTLTPDSGSELPIIKAEGTTTIVGE